MKRNVIFKSALTAEDDESGKISGYASTYNNPDLSGDVMLPGCYDAVLQKIEKSGVMPVMFFSHDHWSVPCGRWDSIKSDDTGLYVTGRVNTDLESGKEIYSALKFGSMSGLSVGFSFSPDGAEDNDAGGFDFKSIDDLFEISICAMPCNERARIDSVKSFDIESIKDYKSAEKYLRDVGYFSREQAKKFISGLKAVFNAERDALRTKAAEQEIIDLIHSFTKKVTNMEEKTNNELLSAIKEFGDKITAVETDVKASRAAIDEKIKNLADEQAKAAKDLNEVLQKTHHENAAGAPAQVKTAGQTFIESAGYKSMLSGEQKSFRLAFKDAIGSQASNSVSRGSIVAPAQGAFVGIPDDTGVKIQDLIPTVQTASNMVEYLKSSSVTNNAAFVAEAAQKPESAFTFKLENCKVETVAHWVRLTRQAYEDAPLVASYIMNKLLIGLRKTIEAQILNGDGTSPNLPGLLTSVSDAATAAGVAKGDTLIDFVLKVKNHIETLNYTPNILILNPAQWTTLSLMKNTLGEYLLGGPAMVAGKSVWNLPVLTSGALPSGKYILGSLQEGCTIYQRMGAEMMASFDDASNFTTNLVTLRAEERLGFAVEDPNALSAGDFSIPTSS